VDLTDSPPAPASRAPLTALRRYARARRAQDENQIAEYQAGTDYETPEFLRINRETYEAELAVPWWLRWTIPVIDRRIEADLDFWHRMGQ
jgi:hypothetical protein